MGGARATAEDMEGGLPTLSGYSTLPVLDALWSATPPLDKSSFLRLGDPTGCFVVVILIVAPPS